MYMPHKRQTIEQHLEECAIAGGDSAPRASAEEIEGFKAKGYSVRDCEVIHEDCAGMFQWLNEDGSFDEDGECYSEASSWALVKRREAKLAVPA